MRVEEVFTRTARRQPHDTAWVEVQDGAATSYAQAAISMEAGARLLASREGSGEPVALLVPNSGAYLIAALSIQRAGSVIVPINVRLAVAEVEHILRDSGARGIVFDIRYEPLLPDGWNGFRVPVEELTSAADGAALAGPLAPASGAEVLSEDAISAIMYTSGTTGRPKGVDISHRAALEAARTIVVESHIRPRDRVLQLMPLTHSAPLHLMAYGSFYAGASQLIGTFNPMENPGMLAEEAARHRATHTFAAPVAYLLGLRADPASQDLSSMRCWIYGGAPMGAEQVNAVRRAYGSSHGAQWMAVYGPTEAGPNGTLLEHEDHDEKAGSIGWRPTLSCEARLAANDGEEVDDGEIGEIWLRSESIMRGYHGRPEDTREVLDEEGWLRTGDLARRDEDGYLWIGDRKKDVIISGGVNVYPVEVEEVLGAHPGITEVAVVGTPHAEWGESVVAMVVPASQEAPTLEELRSFAADKLAEYKMPRRVETIEALPRNPTGKIMKAALRAQVSEVDEMSRTDEDESRD